MAVKKGNVTLLKKGDHLELKGDRNNPESIYASIRFPGGEVYVARTSDGSYWAHITVNHRECGNFNLEAKEGQISGSRVDRVDMATSQVNVGDMNDPNTYHIACKIS